MNNGLNSGRDAATPAGIPASGWKAIIIRTWNEMGSDNLSLIAAGVAFYGLLAVFPAITALVAISGLIYDPADLAQNLSRILSLAPASAADIISGQVNEVVAAQNDTLGLAAVVSLSLALYSASRGVANLITGLNIAYDQKETRGFIGLAALNLTMTVVLMLGFFLGIGAVVVLPGILGILDLGVVTEMLVQIMRWVVLLAFAAAGIGLLYRYGPNRSAPRMMWVMPGAIFACLTWLAASLAFSLYVENFASYNETFGALGGVIALLMWMWLSALIVLLGAELNAEAEYQTTYDTTVGPGMPMGDRGAVKADTVVGGKVYDR